MKLSRRLAFSLAPFAAVPLLARAADAAAKAPPIDPNAPNVVDIDQVLAEFQKRAAYSKYEQELQAKAQKMTDDMNFLLKLRYCSETERQQALQIQAKVKPTSQEEERLKELLAKSDAMDKDLRELSQKATPTKEEAARIAEITKAQQAADDFLGKEKAKREEELTGLRDQKLREVEGELMKFVEKVATERKVGTIYTRQAVLYGGNDLTDEVVRKLPK